MFGQSFVFGSIAGAAASYNISYLSVAGGASGGARDAGGGGAGGMLESTVDIYEGTTYTITVGGGGASVTASSAYPSGFKVGNNGSASSIFRR